MQCQQLFNYFLNHTIKSKFLHLLLILFEYYPIIISTLESPFKFKHYSYSISQYNQSSLNISLAFPFRQIPNGLSNIINIILLSLILFFMLLYHCTNFTIVNRTHQNSLSKKQSPNHSKTIKNPIIIGLIKLYVNFYDLIYYRYCSLFIMLLFVNVIIFYLNQSTLISGIVAIVIIIIFIVYYMSMMTHVKNYATITHITNPTLLAMGTYEYPFDYHCSLYYDMYVTRIKLLTAIEYVVFSSSTTVNKVVLFLNVLMLILLIIALLGVVNILFITADLEYYIFNREINMHRMNMVMINFLTVVFVIVFIDVLNDNYILFIGIIVFSFIWACWLFITLWTRRILPLWYDGNVTLQKIMFITTRHSFKSDTIISLNSSIHNSNSNNRGRDNEDGQSVPFWEIDANKVIQSFKLYHQINCKSNDKSVVLSKAKCKICCIYEKDIMYGTDLMKIFKYHSNLYRKTDHRAEYHFYDDLFMYFYYHFHKRTFMFYMKYKAMITSPFTHVSSGIPFNLDTMTEICRVDELNENVTVYDEAIKFDTLNAELLAALKSMLDFICLADILKYPDRIFQLAKDIKRLKDNVLLLHNTIDNKDDPSNSNISIKTLKNVNKYNMTINRFIVESLTNEVYHQLNPLDIDALDEYLLSHYQNDKVLILRFDLIDQYVNANTIKIIGCGNEFINYRQKSFIDIFPQKYRSTGIDLFIKKLMKYIEYETNEKTNCNNGYNSKNSYANIDNNNIKHSNDDKTGCILYEYLVTNNLQLQSQGTSSHLQSQIQLQGQLNTNPMDNYEYVEYFKYSFSISHTLINNSLFIHGYYSNDKKNIIVFRTTENTIVNPQSTEMILDSFSSSLRNIFQINPQWIEIINLSLQPLYFSILFQNIRKGQESRNEYECDFDFVHFYNHIKKFKGLMKEYYEGNVNRKEDKENIAAFYQKMKDKSRSSTLQIIQMNLKRRLAFKHNHKNYIVYSINLNSKTTKLGKSDNEGWDNNIDYMQYAYTPGSLNNENSLAGSTHSSSQYSRLRQNIKEDQNQVSHITKTFSIFSYLIILFNCIIIFLCIFFLIFQLIKVNQITQVNNLFYKFKSVRLFYAHAFNSLMCNICIANKSKNTCLNPYIEYSNSLNKDYSTREFIKEELKQKIDFIQLRFKLLKDSLYSYRDRNLINLSSNIVTYISLNENDKKVTQEKIMISFEEALRKYINSLYILSKSDIEYGTEVMYIISVDNQQVDFSNLEETILNQNQREFYQISINYNNYLNYYTIGEKAITNEFIKIKSSNEQAIIIIMILIGIFNLITFALSFWMIIIAKKLFMQFISYMINAIGEEGYAKFMYIKVKNLIKLSRLYDKNPNDIIMRIKKNETRPFKSKLNGLSNENKKDNKGSSNTNAKTEEAILKFKSKEKNTITSQINNSILSERLKPYYQRTSYLTLAYVLLITTLDSIVIVIFQNTFIINDYADFNAQFENKIYTTLSLIQQKLLINISDHDAAEGLDYKTIDNDGIINMKIREAMDSLHSISIIEQYKKGSFPAMGSYYPTNCSDFFQAVADPLTINVNNEFNKDYFQLQNSLCESYNIMDLPDYHSLYNHQIFLSQRVANHITLTNYNALMSIFQSKDYLDLMTLTLLVMRPLRYQIRNVILDKRLKDSLDNLITIMVIYLCFNIFLDFLICLMIRYTIAKRLYVMHDNLLMFHQCFQAH